MTMVLFCFCSGCDKNSPRKPGPNGEGEEDAKYVDSLKIGFYKKLVKLLWRKIKEMYIR